MGDVLSQGMVVAATPSGLVGGSIAVDHVGSSPRLLVGSPATVTAVTPPIELVTCSGRIVLAAGMVVVPYPSTVVSSNRGSIVVISIVVHGAVVSGAVDIGVT
jgi:hypothetical protein